MRAQHKQRAAAFLDLLYSPKGADLTLSGANVGWKNGARAFMFVCRVVDVKSGSIIIKYQVEPTDDATELSADDMAQ
eukprot:COSAG06_NODE_6198_length_3054_cov_3.929949_1_plen_76_part_10